MTTKKRTKKKTVRRKINAEEALCSNILAYRGPRADIRQVRFGYLVAIHFIDCKGWLCRCDCGREKKIRLNRLLQGITKSCGCKRGFLMLSKKPGPTKHQLAERDAPRAHLSWRKIYAAFRNGKGDQMTPRWFRFIHFLADMGERPPGAALRRHKPEAPYSKENCFWHRTLRPVNADGRLIVSYYEFEGKMWTLPGLARHVGVSYSTLFNRVVNRGVPVTVAVARGRVVQGSVILTKKPA